MTPPPRHLVLVGLMGVGKTSVGRALAERLSWRLSDSDVVIEARYGATVRELNERLGTDGMHRLETEQLLGELAEPTPSVICAAASIVDSPRCRHALRQPEILVVWLRGDAELLAQRFSSGPHRPVLGTDPGKLFRDQIALRTRRFAALKPYRVEVEGRSPAQIAAEIEPLLAV